MAPRTRSRKWALFLLSSLCLPACTIYLLPGEGEATPSEDAQLPEPDNVPIATPLLTPEQQARKAEVDAYIQAMYKDYSIAATKQGPSGDIVDWVDNSAFELPDELPVIPFPAGDLILPEGIELPQSELDTFPELLGPEGTTPLLRPDFSAYIMGESGAVSLQDYLDNHQVFGIPAGTDRLYAGLDVLQPNRGVMAIVNHYQGEVEDKTFSLMELSVACPADGPIQEAIGVVLSIDRVNFKSLLDDEEAQRPRLHIEVLREVNGELKGVWDLREKLFTRLEWDLQILAPAISMPVPTVIGGGVTLSEIEGAQYEHMIQIFQVFNGDWWIAYRGDLLGRYKANLFTLLNKGACRAHFYEEVYNGTSGTWTTTDMGSGEYAEAGANRADYFRRMMILNNYWSVQEVDDTMGIFSRPYEPTCYSRTPTKNGGPLTGFYFFADGPGADSPLCK